MYAPASSDMGTLHTMSLKVFTGLPASGKTSALIDEMVSRKETGGRVLLVLSSEHESLTKRSNVKAGGLMGCRDENKSFPIDAVMDSSEAASLLAAQEPDTMVVFDEAQYFKPDLVSSWQSASERGVDVLVGTPSAHQLQRLADIPHEPIHLEVECSCGRATASQVLYQKDLTYPQHLCSDCHAKQKSEAIASLLADVRISEPFPDTLHTYQPFYDLDMKGWALVRTDCPARLNVILDAVSRCDSVGEKLADPLGQASFIDLGCCSGFFSDAMACHGFRSAGVDISKDFIDWASRLANIKAQDISYEQSDLMSYLTSSAQQRFDVISTFATVQWVMAQSGYGAGLTCFEAIFERANSICVIEMGYTAEPIYRDKITDRPVEIDRQWVLNLMEQSGHFDTIELHPMGENGIWRDIFVGFKEAPSSPRIFDDFPVTAATQTSNAEGYWSDNWAGPELDVWMQAEKDASLISIDGWCPEQCSGATLTLYLSGQKSKEVKLRSGKFRIELPCSITQGDFFEFHVSADKSFKAEGDARQLSFILLELDFQ